MLSATRARLRAPIAAVGVAVIAVLGQPAPAAAGPADATPARQRELVRLVRQDCGSCHGMQLTGGLGPPLTREALSSRTAAALAVLILHGKPGTPMPPWRALLSEADAQWIAARLVQGFPAEPGERP